MNMPSETMCQGRMHQVINTTTGKACYTGKLADCKAWMRRYNAFFFCEVKPCASESCHAKQSKPSSQPSTTWNVNYQA